MFKFVATLPAGATRNAAMETLGGSFASRFRDTLPELLAKITDPAERAAATFGAARGIAHNTPAAAAALAAGITDPVLRDSANAAIYRRWMRIDSVAAKAWLPTVNIAPEWKTYIEREASEP